MQSYKEKVLAEAEKSIFTFFLKRSKIAYLAAVGILLSGLVSTFLIPKESAPKIDFGIIAISTFYNGASAVDMDSLVTEKIESYIKDIDGIKKIDSTSRNSLSSITVELDPYADTTEVLNEIRSEIDKAKSELPEDAEDSNILKIDSTLDPLFTLHLSGEVHPVLLRDYAEDLSDYMENNQYIKEVSIQGGGEREIYVDLDPLKLKQYNLASSDVISAIRRANVDYPIGNIDIEGNEYDLRFSGKYKSAEDINKVVIKNIKSEKGSSPIYAEDLGEIYELEKDTESIVKLTTIDTGIRQNTVKIVFNKAGESDIFKVDPIIRAEIESFAEKNFGPEVRLSYVNEMLENVRESYDNVVNNGLQAIIIVAILMIFFIGIKEGLITGSIIPFTFLTTISVFYFNGDPLTFMSNFSMILALGIIVDTAIVIVEGIHDGIKKGFTPKEAAMISIYEFKTPLISGMLTTLAVFVPLLSLPGIMGKYLSFIPITVSITLIASLFIALLIIPAIAVKFLAKDKVQERKIGWFGRSRLMIEKLYKVLETRYYSFSKRNLISKGRRRFLVWGTIFAFIASMFIPTKFEMFPSDDFDLFTVSVKTAAGTSTEETEKAVYETEKILIKIPEVKYIESITQENKGSIYVQLEKKDIRQESGMRTSIEIIQKLQREFKKFKNYQVVAQEISRGPSGGNPVAFRVIVADTNKIPEAQDVVEDLKLILENTPGTDGVKDDLNNTPGEIRYEIDRAKALALGVSPDIIGSIVRSAIEGSEATDITKNGREVKVTVRYKDGAIQNFDDIGEIQIPNNQGKTISLSQVVKRELKPGLMNIKRVDGKIAITVSSFLSEGGNALEITTKVKKELENYETPEGITIEDAGENQENQDLFIGLLIGFIAAVFMIFTILVIQFDSFRQPLIILFTIIMAQFGVNVGLFLTDTFRSLAFIIGVISLAGIVVNDAIILIDRINKLREEYKDKLLHEIIAMAGESRLQPIILTTLTTAAGIMPLLWVDQFWKGLAVTIIFGLMVASTLTLFVTPALYYGIEKKNFEKMKKEEREKLEKPRHLE